MQEAPPRLLSMDDDGGLTLIRRLSLSPLNAIEAARMPLLTTTHMPHASPTMSFYRANARRHGQRMRISDTSCYAIDASRHN